SSPARTGSSRRLLYLRAVWLFESVTPSAHRRRNSAKADPYRDVLRASSNIGVGGALGCINRYRADKNEEAPRNVRDATKMAAYRRKLVTKVNNACVAR